MGSITLTKAKGIWQTLPAPLRGAVTLLAVLALAALLTTVRHNASAYLTGVWDTGSQTLVYGRIHQMEQGQYAPGGFLGVYTDDWSDDTNRALFRDDTPTDAAAFHPYTHQSGLQGWLFGRVNRLLRHWLPDGLARETALYWLNSTLFYAAELLVALAVWEEFGPLAAAFGFASVLLAPWLQRTCTGASGPGCCRCWRRFGSAIAPACAAKRPAGAGRWWLPPAWCAACAGLNLSQHF